MEKENCKFCRHFYQHFVRTGRDFVKLSVGTAHIEKNHFANLFHAKCLNELM